MRIDARGALYMPFRVAVYAASGADGAAIAFFDWPSTLLAGLGRRELDEIGEMLDREIASAVLSATLGE